MSTTPNPTTIAPIAPFALSFVLGIAVCRLYPSVILASAIAIAVILAFAIKQYKVALYLTVGLLGSFNLYRTITSEVVYPSTVQIYKADIINVAENNSSTTAAITVNAYGRDTTHLTKCNPFKARLTITGFETGLEENGTIVFRSKLEPIVPRIDFPDERSPEQTALNQDIVLKSIISPSGVISTGRPTGIKGWFADLRQHCIKLLLRSSLDSDTKEFLSTTLFGVNDYLMPEIRTTFARSGLSHLLALSGLHIGILAFLIAIALWPLKMLGTRHYYLDIITIVVLWFYAMLTGMSASVTRAVIMVTIYLLARMTQQRSSPMNSLLLAALLILIFDPQSLFAVGFQLSFAAVATIILFADRLNPIKRQRKWYYTVSSYVAVSISAMLGSGLIATMYFHTFPIYFIAANLAAALLLPVILAGGIVTLILEAIGISNVWISDTVSALYFSLKWIAEIISKIPGSTLHGIYLPWWITIIYVLLLGALYFWLSLKKIIWGYLTSAIVIVFFAVAIFFKAPKSEPCLYLMRDSYMTILVIDNDSNRLNVLTTRPQEAEAIKDRINNRLSDFMAIRGIDSTVILDMNSAIGPGFSVKNGLLKWGNKKIAIIDNTRPLPTERVDYAVVSGATASIDRWWEAVEKVADTIVVAPDLRTIKWSEIDSAKYIDCNQRAWRLPWSEPGHNS